MANKLQINTSLCCEFFKGKMIFRKGPAYISFDSDIIGMFLELIKMEIMVKVMTVHNFIVIEMTKETDGVTLTSKFVGSYNTLSTIKLHKLDIRDLMINKHRIKTMMRECSEGFKKQLCVESNATDDTDDCDIVCIPQTPIKKKTGGVLESTN